MKEEEIRYFTENNTKHSLDHFRKMNNDLNKFSLLRDTPTPALSPNPLHCWGKPPSVVLGSAVTWQSPAAAPPALPGSSSPLRRSPAWIWRQSALRRWTGCRRIKTSRPAKSTNPSGQDINTLTWLRLSSRLYLTREREPGFCVWELLEQLDQSFCLFDTRDGFKRQNISFCCCKAFNLGSVPCFKLLGLEKTFGKRWYSKFHTVCIIVLYYRIWCNCCEKPRDSLGCSSSLHNPQCTQSRCAERLHMVQESLLPRAISDRKSIFLPDLHCSRSLNLFHLPTKINIVSAFNVFQFNECTPVTFSFTVVFIISNGFIFLISLREKKSLSI